MTDPNSNVNQSQYLMNTPSPIPEHEQYQEPQQNVHDFNNKASNHRKIQMNQ